MTIEYRVTIRLTAEVYAQLEARGSHGQPLAAMAASIEMLQGRVDHRTARVDTLAAAWQPVTATDSAQQPAGSHGRGSDSHR
jgi:phage-related minor tail protein